MQESQITGCIVGLAVGDALGYPAEFRLRFQLVEEIGPQGITDFIALKDPRFSKPQFIAPDHPLTQIYWARQRAPVVALQIELEIASLTETWASR